MTWVPGPYEVLIVQGDRETLHPDIPGLPNQRILKSYGDSLERAVLLGLSSAKGDRIVVLDADGSHPVHTVPKMFQGLLKYDMVVGSRYLPDSEFEYSTFRTFVSWCFKTYAHVLGSRLSDPMSGFFGVRKEIIEKIRFRPIPWKTALEIELKASPEVMELPIKFTKRQEGMSKATAKTGLSIIWGLVTR